MKGGTTKAMNATCECLEAQNKELDGILAQYKGQKDALITVLHKAQELFGYLPQAVQIRVAEALDVPLSEVYGVVTFYALFSTKPKGKYKISACKGTACYVRGSERVLERIEKELGIKAGDTTADAKFSLEVVRCLGACGLGPVIMVNDDVHARLKPDKIPGVLSRYK